MNRTGRFREIGFDSEAVAVATAEAAAAATIPGTLGALAGLIDGQGSAAELLSVESSNGGFCLFLAAQVDETEAARAPGGAIGDQLHVHHLAAILLEESTELIFVCGIREITDKQPGSHGNAPYLTGPGSTAISVGLTGGRTFPMSLRAFSKSVALTNSLGRRN
jgi:hypothetical protein